MNEYMTIRQHEVFVPKGDTWHTAIVFTNLFFEQTDVLRTENIFSEMRRKQVVWITHKKLLSTITIVCIKLVDSFGYTSDGVNLQHHMLILSTLSCSFQ